VRILFAALLVATCPAPGRAAGVCLAWTQCYGDGGVQLRTFACNTNAGSNRLVASYVAPAGITQLTGNEVTIDFDAGSTFLPLWWQFRNTGVCRQNALTVNVTQDAAWTVCQDYWMGQALAGIGSYDIGFDAPNRARLRIAVAVAQVNAGPLEAGQEYFSTNVLVSNIKTVGTPSNSCAGCATPLCITLSSIKLTQPNGVTTTLQQPAYPAGYPVGPRFSHIVFWQSLGGTNCFVVPARATTWGAVKSLYR
jgi:hypothetical protein